MNAQGDITFSAERSWFSN